LFWKFNILDFIEKLWDGFEEKTTQIVDKNPDDNLDKKEEEKNEKVSKVRYDRITAKAISYYIFLLFFRSAVVVIGIIEIELFMQDLIAYLPSLFVGILIGFFGLRFANSVHDIIYQALELTKDRTSKIIAT
jgi:C4-dicarboxylate transporter